MRRVKLSGAIIQSRGCVAINTELKKQSGMWGKVVLVGRRRQVICRQIRSRKKEVYVGARGLKSSRLGKEKKIATVRTRESGKKGGTGLRLNAT